MVSQRSGVLVVPDECLHFTLAVILPIAQGRGVLTSFQKSEVRPPRLDFLPYDLLGRRKAENDLVRPRERIGVYLPDIFVTEEGLPKFVR